MINQAVPPGGDSGIALSQVEACDLLKRGRLGCTIFGRGGLRSRIPRMLQFKQNLYCTMSVNHAIETQWNGLHLGCILCGDVSYVRLRISLFNSGSWYSVQPLFGRVVTGRRTHQVSAQCCELTELYSTRTCDVSRHLVVTTHSWVHTNLTAPQQCQRKLHKVQTYAASRFVSRQLSFPLHTKVAAV